MTQQSKIRECKVRFQKDFLLSLQEEMKTTSTTLTLGEFIQDKIENLSTARDTLVNDIQEWNRKYNDIYHSLELAQNDRRQLQDENYELQKDCNQKAEDAQKSYTSFKEQVEAFTDLQKQSYLLFKELTSPKGRILNLFGYYNRFKKKNIKKK